MEKNRHTHQNSNINYHPIVQKILRNRDFSEEEMAEFFSWNLQSLPDLSQLKDLDKGARRIVEAILQDHVIGIYGDYDVDGTTSCALFYHFFKMLGKEVLLFQPSRFVDGYGLHKSSIDVAKEKNVDVLITVDCGITNTEAAQYALDQGLDLIITDHHKDGAPEMPKALAVINPNRRDEEESPLKYLAGVGVAFAVCVEVRKILLSLDHDCPSLYSLLQFVSIGTICDLAKLDFVNLKLVRHGLKQIPETKYPGVRAFFGPQERSYNHIPSEKISFNVGPLINSKGRIDHPESALNLLTTFDDTVASKFYRELELSNSERKRIQREVFEQAKANILKTHSPEQEMFINVVYHPTFHEGVVGIVASKLVETFSVPAIVFTDSEDEGIIKGSARTAGTVSIFNLLNEASDLFIKFGGHHSAAGLSLKKENLIPLRRSLEESIKKFPKEERINQDHYDLEIPFEDITPRLAKELESMEPFGQGNAKPVFLTRDFKLDSFILLKDVHVKWTFGSVKKRGLKLTGISFNYMHKWEAISPEDILQFQEDKRLKMQFTININRFNGKEFLQLMVNKIDLEERI